MKIKKLWDKLVNRGKRKKELELSEEFFEKYKDKINWKFISTDTCLDVSFFEKYEAIDKICPRTGRKSFKIQKINK